MLIGDQLFRVLVNLGRNAEIAMRDQAEKGQAGMISVTAWRQSSTLHIEVTDTGPGIPMRAQEHLFEAFAGSTEPGGTGLGLAIAHEIMRAHGGDIELDRTGEDGTTFRLSLPSG